MNMRGYLIHKMKTRRQRPIKSGNIIRRHVNTKAIHVADRAEQCLDLPVIERRSRIGSQVYAKREGFNCRKPIDVEAANPRNVEFMCAFGRDDLDFVLPIGSQRGLADYSFKIQVRNKKRGRLRVCEKTDE